MTIYVPCRDNPEVHMARRADGCWECQGPRTPREGLMPLSDMASIDAHRRSSRVFDLSDGLTWLDYGAGHGCDVEYCAKLYSVRGEPWDPATGEPEPTGHYDLVTLFHVIEHVDDPVALLRQVRERFTPRTLIIETPNAADWLLDVCPAYLRHWCWTDHRLVMTAEALLAAGRSAGLGEGKVMFIQRYPVGNTLRWLVEGKPGGHADAPWCAIGYDGDPQGDMHYEEALGKRTDTLWCEWRMA